jgi:hypothetical protein
MKNALISRLASICAEAVGLPPRSPRLAALELEADALVITIAQLTVHERRGASEPPRGRRSHA